MWPRIAVVAAVLALSGCASQRAEYFAQRDAPDLSFKGPVRPLTLSSAQIKLVQKGVADGLKDSGPPGFGRAYRAGMNAEREIVVCGYVNGKRFVGMFARPQGAPTQFLPIGVGIDEQAEGTVKLYCRADGIYLPQ
jgi:hypothetical protein